MYKNKEQHAFQLKGEANALKDNQFYTYIYRD